MLLVSVYLILLFDWIAVPLFLRLHLYFAVWRIPCPCPYLPVSSFVWRWIYVCIICGWLFSSEPLSGDDVLCRLLARPVPSVCFISLFVCLFVLFSLTIVFVLGLFWSGFVYLVTSAEFVADQLKMWDKRQQRVRFCVLLSLLFF